VPLHPAPRSREPWRRDDTDPAGSVRVGARQRRVQRMAGVSQKKRFELAIRTDQRVAARRALDAPAAETRYALHSRISTKRERSTGLERERRCLSGQRD
jgi:hypothetical protein